MSRHVSIFDIPHIAAGIGCYLTRRDLASCTLVSKTFHEQFRRLLWRELVYEKPGDSECEDMEISMDYSSVINNCQWTRSLTIGPNCQRRSLNVLMSHFRRLEILKSHLIRSRDEEEDPFFSEVVKLVNNNADLRCWSMYLQGNLPPSVLVQLTKAVSQKSRLTVLELGLGFRPRCGWLKHVLQNLPPTLRGLYLNWRYLQGINGPENFPEQDWPVSYPSLEVVDFAIRMADKDVPDLIQFLSRCTVLSELGIPTLLSNSTLGMVISLLESKEKLDCLTTLDLGLFIDIDESNWRRLLWAMKGRVKGFATCVPFNATATRSYVVEMVSQWADTLQTIILGLPMSITSRDIHLILSKCSKLKRVDCLIGRIVNPSVYAWESNPGVEGVFSSADGGDWACVEIEEFKMMFADSRKKDAIEPILTLQEKWTASAICYAYQQIGRLTKLKDLSIGWWTTDDFAGCSNLDMSLRSGLGYMEGLKSLRTLDITHVRNVDVGLEEMEWMDVNWPQLRTITGLQNRLNMEVRKVPDLNCIFWPRSAGVPDLMIM